MQIEVFMRQTVFRAFNADLQCAETLSLYNDIKNIVFILSF